MHGGIPKFRSLVVLGIVARNGECGGEVLCMAIDREHREIDVLGVGNRATVRYAAIEVNILT